MDRRDFLIKSALAAGAGLVACRGEQFGDTDAINAAVPQPSGRVRDVMLTAEPIDVDLGDGKRFKVFGYNGTMPAPEIRVREGDTSA